jgi:hypothetical protein
MESKLSSSVSRKPAIRSILNKLNSVHPSYPVSKVHFEVILLSTLIINKLREAESFRSWQSLSQGIPYLLCSPTVHYRVQKGPLLDPILSRSNQVHTLKPYLWYVLIISTHLCRGLPSGCFPVGFSTGIFWEFLISHMRAIRPTHHNLFDIITLIIFSEDYIFFTEYC